jgi:hypothetical protein
MTQWLYEIHEKNPYESFPINEFDVDLQGWGFESEIFDYVITTYRPQVVIEVGTWKGASANKMASLLKAYGIRDPQLICIDTWLGSLEHWSNREAPEFFESLRIKWGRPDIYNQFLANVLLMGNAEVIIPFPIHSAAAVRFLTAKKLLADAIYIDAGHEYEDVLADIKGFWKLVKPGGVMFGDDYILGWIGVVRAVHDFADEHGLAVNSSFYHKWLFEKHASG